MSSSSCAGVESVGRSTCGPVLSPAVDWNCTTTEAGSGGVAFPPLVLAFLEAGACSSAGPSFVVGGACAGGARGASAPAPALLLVSSAAMAVWCLVRVE